MGSSKSGSGSKVVDSVTKSVGKALSSVLPKSVMPKKFTLIHVVILGVVLFVLYHALTDTVEGWAGAAAGSLCAPVDTKDRCRETKNLKMAQMVLKVKSKQTGVCINSNGTPDGSKGTSSTCNGTGQKWVEKGDLEAINCKQYETADTCKKAETNEGKPACAFKAGASALDKKLCETQASKTLCVPKEGGVVTDKTTGHSATCKWMECDKIDFPETTYDKSELNKWIECLKAKGKEGVAKLLTVHGSRQQNDTRVKPAVYHKAVGAFPPGSKSPLHDANMPASWYAAGGPFERLSKGTLEKKRTRACAVSATSCGSDVGKLTLASDIIYGLDPTGSYITTLNYDDGTTKKCQEHEVADTGISCSDSCSKPLRACKRLASGRMEEPKVCIEPTDPVKTATTIWEVAAWGARDASAAAVDVGCPTPTVNPT